jgi:hypothetical protein
LIFAFARATTFDGFLWDYLPFPWVPLTFIIPLFEVAFFFIIVNFDGLCRSLITKALLFGALHQIAIRSLLIKFEVVYILGILWVESLCLSIWRNYLSTTLQKGQENQKGLETSHPNYVQVKAEQFLGQIIAQIVENTGRYYCTVQQ